MEASDSVVTDLPEIQPSEELKSQDEIEVKENTGKVFGPYQFEKPWVNLYMCHKEFENFQTHSFLKGCKWSADGTCLLTCANDNILRLFDLPSHFYQNTNWVCDESTPTELTPSLKIKEGEIIYDYCWHPLMSSWQPETCV